jgi:hypothetical protein
MSLARVVALRLAAGLPEAGPGAIPCFGACGGAAGAKLPPYGLYCTVCQGSGKLPYYDPRKLDADSWDHVQAARAEQAERAYKRRDAAKREARRVA